MWERVYLQALTGRMTQHTGEQSEPSPWNKYVTILHSVSHPWIYTLLRLLFFVSCLGNICLLWGHIFCFVLEDILFISSIFRSLTYLELILCMVWEKGKSFFFLFICRYAIYHHHHQPFPLNHKDIFVEIRQLYMCEYVSKPFNNLTWSQLGMHSRTRLLWVLQEHEWGYLL